MSSNPLLHAHVSGAGTPVVLLHGFLSSLQYFNRFKRRLQKDHQVITVDLLGFGLSPKLEVPITYEMQVEALHATLTQLKLSRPYHILGHSMGALIALRYSLTYPQEVQTVMLLNPPIITDDEQAKDTYAGVSRFHAAVLYSPKRKKHWRAITRLPRNPTRFRTAVNFTDTARMSYGALEGGYHHIIARGEFLSDLQKAQHRTLLVIGLRDRHIYATNLRAVTTPALVTPHYINTGHHSLVTHPTLTESLIRRHLIQ